MIERLKETLALMEEIECRQAVARPSLPDSMALHVQRMAYVDMRLAEITRKLERLKCFRDDDFRRPQ